MQPGAGPGLPEPEGLRVPAEQHQEWLDRLREAPWIRLDTESQVLLQHLGLGAFAPLNRFLSREEAELVIREGRLVNGAPWPIPILLPATGRMIPAGGGEPVALLDSSERILGWIEVQEEFGLDPVWAVRHLFQTEDPRHPGVDRFLGRAGRYVGGRIRLLTEPERRYGPDEPTPGETRIRIQELGLRSLAVFPTRGIPDRGTEALIRSALAMVDGVLILSLLGWHRPGDYVDQAIVRAHQALLQGYFPPDRVLLAAFRLPPFFAGPREIMLQAMAGRSFGATHLLVDRHQPGLIRPENQEELAELFDQMDGTGLAALSIRGEFHHCRRCGGTVTDRSCPHPEGERRMIQPRDIRRQIASGEQPAPEVVRPEVSQAIQSVAPSVVPPSS